MSPITIQVDSEIAQAFASASPEEQQKIQTLLSQWLKQAISVSQLQSTMDPDEPGGTGSKADL